jgi:hypothetical protein
MPRAVRPTPSGGPAARITSSDPRRGARDVEPVLRSALVDPAAVARATALLEELAALLLDDRPG